MTVWTVSGDPTNPSLGKLVGLGFEGICALGKSGTIAATDKSEGDGYTPLGAYPFRQLFYRADKLPVPDCALPTVVIGKNDGWCDDSAHRCYNQQVFLPFSSSHEKLWRDDDIYDLLVVIGHNDAPTVPGKGSAIFMHIARQGYKPTEGCVALSKEDMIEFLKRVQPGDILEIQ